MRGDGRYRAVPEKAVVLYPTIHPATAERAGRAHRSQRSPSLRPGGPTDYRYELPDHLLAVAMLDGVRDASLDVILQQQQ